MNRGSSANQPQDIGPLICHALNACKCELTCITPKANSCIAPVRRSTKLCGKPTQGMQFVRSSQLTPSSAPRLSTVSGHQPREVHIRACRSKQSPLSTPVLCFPTHIATYNQHYTWTILKSQQCKVYVLSAYQSSTIAAEMRLFSMHAWQSLQIMPSFTPPHHHHHMFICHSK